MTINYVVGFLYSEDNENVLLINKKRPLWQFGFWNGIGGKIEKGESPYDAMVREFEEEAGLYIESWKSGIDLRCPDFSIFYFFSHSNKIFNYMSKTDEKVSVFNTNNVPVNMIFPSSWIYKVLIDRFVELPISINYSANESR